MCRSTSPKTGSTGHERVASPEHVVTEEGFRPEPGRAVAGLGTDPCIQPRKHCERGVRADSQPEQVHPGGSANRHRQELESHRALEPAEARNADVHPDRCPAPRSKERGVGSDLKCHPRRQADAECDGRCWPLFRAAGQNGDRSQEGNERSPHRPASVPQREQLYFEPGFTTRSWHERDRRGSGARLRRFRRRALVYIEGLGECFVPLVRP
jgi:hypothetical protein